MRKIERSEVNRAAAAFAEIFKDYSAYDLFFKRDRAQLKKIEWFYRFEIFVSADYTYVSDNFKCLCAIKRPNDKDRNSLKLILNPAFSLPFVCSVSVKSIKLAREYIRFADKIAVKYYNPATDCYIKNIGVAESERGKGKLKEMLNEFTAGHPCYLETHDPKNVEIYRHLGFDVVEIADFHGVAHYAMKRK